MQKNADIWRILYKTGEIGGKVMKRMKKAVVWIVAVCLLLSVNITSLATSDATPPVAQAREGVLQIRLYYVDNNGNEHALQGGSGFLIGASTGATTVITNYHVIFPDSEQRTQYSEMFGVDFNNSNEINLRIKVVVKRDVEIEASYVNGSEQTDFAILELQQAIYDRAPLKLADSDQVVETQSVYALGFPSVTSAVQDDQVYTSDDVTITNGIVGKFQDVNNIGFILHNVSLGHGNSGGPLVNSEGNVIGVNTMFTDLDDASNYYYSIAINEIADVLDALGITYETAESSAAAGTEEPEAQETPAVTGEEPVPEEITEGTGTEEPVPSVTEETTEPAVQDEVEEIVEVDAAPNYLLIGGSAAVVAIVVIVAVVGIVSAKKSKTRKSVPPAGGMPVNPSGLSGQAGGMGHQPVNTGAPTPPFMPNTMPMDSGAGETSVLGGGAGETSVLGGGAMQPAAVLTRRRNNESVRITKPQFVIGRERQRVDFCIPDNDSVGRTHASIICKGGIYYIIDKNSKNFTFVNGNKISPNQEVKLNSGDKIKLADEEFDFQV